MGGRPTVRNQGRTVLGQIRVSAVRVVVELSGFRKLRITPAPERWPEPLDLKNLEPIVQPNFNIRTLITQPENSKGEDRQRERKQLQEGHPKVPFYQADHYSGQ